jgi:hypothetical protein
MSIRPKEGQYWSTKDIEYGRNLLRTEKAAVDMAAKTQKERLEALVTIMPDAEITYVGHLALKVTTKEGEMLLDSKGHPEKPVDRA